MKLEKEQLLEWEEKELGQIGVFLKGAGIDKSAAKSSGIPAVRYGEIYTNHDFYIKRFFTFIDEVSAKKSKKISCGDILFASSGETIEDIGKCVTYLGTEVAYAGGDITIFRSNQCDSRFLAYLLNHECVKRQTYKLGQGQSIVHLYASEIKKIKIRIPSIEEQKAIGEVLFKWDEAVEEIDVLIERKKTYKKGWGQRLLMGESRFKEFTRSQYEPRKLKGLLKERSTRNKKLEFDRVLSVTNTNGFVVQTEHFDKVVASKDVSNYKIVKRGQFGYNPSRVNVGSIARLENYDNGILSPMYVIFETKQDELLPEYMNQFIKSYNFLGKVRCLTQGSVRDSLDFDSLEQIRLFVPSIEEQKKIAEFLSAIDEEIKILEEQRDALKLQKKGLMQRLLTGEVRVKVKL